MASEAHITNVAVRKDYYRQGIGELLLIAMIDLARELNARLLTLEVRISNLAAQNLYYKYGFARAGQRRGYYTDNKEDALVMSVEDITVPSFRTRFKRLKEAHSERWGAVRYHPLPSPPQTGGITRPHA
jgi:ribosomal-protein-alanine N-acetyltransferase